ncbi:MAG: Uma2 family endonuclease [Bacteroidota bacterium]
MITSFDQLDLSKRYTYADYLTWQFQERVELLRGLVRKMSPAPTDTHQRIILNLSFLFKGFLKGKKCQARPAPYDVRLIIAKDTPMSSKRRKTAKSVSDEEIQTVVQPDLSVICDPSKIDRRGCLGSPDLVIEILSEGNNQDDTVEKFAIYESAGIPEYWMIHPYEQTVIIYILDNEGKYIGSKPYVPSTQLTSEVLPGLVIDVEEIFE